MLLTVILLDLLLLLLLAFQRLPLLLNRLLALLLRRRWFWVFYRQVYVQDEGDNRDSNAPVLKLIKVCIEQEYIEEELVDHLKVTQHLELACRLVLKGE